MFKKTYNPISTVDVGFDDDYDDDDIGDIYMYSVNYSCDDNNDF